MSASKHTFGSSKDRPTLLMIGQGEPMDAALRQAFDRHGLFVEESTTQEASGAVRVSAPDLVLLVGDATRDGGRRVLELLSADPSTGVVPVAVLTEDEATLDKRVLAFRYGATAVVPRSASADEIGRRVAQLARELPERAAAAAEAELGEATLDELVALVTRELRSGILSVGRQGDTPQRIVLGAGRPVADAVEEFVKKLRPLVSRAEPLAYEFHKDGAGGAVGLLDLDGAPAADLTLFEGLRVLLVDHDPSRADTLAQELRSRGAIVAVTDTSGRGLSRATGLDPEVVVMDAGGMEGSGFEVVRALRRDVRLRWASILVAPWDELWPDPRGAPDAERIAEKVAPLVLHDRALRERATREPSFDVRLEATGPCRLLRVLAGLPGAFHVAVRSARATVEVDVTEGLVVGAAGETTAGEPLESTGALAALLAMGSGRVHVERRANPTHANVMAPVDEALAQASSEVPPLAPSIPPGPADSSDSGLEPRRRPFPDASELGRDGVELFSGLDSDELARPVPVPLTSTRLTPTSAHPSVAAGLSWDDDPEDARPRPSAKADGERDVRRAASPSPAIPTAPRVPQEMRAAVPSVVPSRQVVVSEPPQPSAEPLPLSSPRTGRRTTVELAPGVASASRGSEPSEARPLGRITPRKTLVGIARGGGVEEEVTASGYDLRAEAPLPSSPPESLDSFEELPLESVRPGPSEPAEAGFGQVTSASSPGTVPAGMPPPPTDVPVGFGEVAATSVGERWTPAGVSMAATLEPEQEAEPAPRPAGAALPLPPTAARPTGNVGRTLAKAALAVAILTIAGVIVVVAAPQLGVTLPGLTPQGIERSAEEGDESSSALTGLAPVGTEEPATEPAADEGSPSPSGASSAEPSPSAEDVPVVDADDAPPGSEDAPASAAPTEPEPAAGEPATANTVAPAEPSSAEGTAPAEPAATEQAPSEAQAVEELLSRARQSPPAVAETLYRRVLEADSQNHYAMIGLAELLMARGAPAAALPYVEEAVRRRSRRAAYRVFLGDVRRANGDEDGAVEAYEAALRLEPENRQALRRLGRTPE